MTNLSSLRTAPSRTIAERRASSVERRAPTTNPTPPAVSAMDTRPARIGLGVLRMATGFMFLWTFFDKTFGPGYSTVMARAWINGGSPSQGYLTSAEISGPLKPLFAAIASPASDILFRLGVRRLSHHLRAGADRAGPRLLRRHLGVRARLEAPSVRAAPTRADLTASGRRDAAFPAARRPGSRR
jgi:hypothetical protein